MPLKPLSEISNSLKIIVSSISVIGVIVGAFLTIDSRYVLASDFEQYQKQSNEVIRRQTVQLQTQGTLLRKQLVEDRMFELDAKREHGTLSPVEEAQYRRYERQQQELDKVLVNTQGQQSQQ